MKRIVVALSLALGLAVAQNTSSIAVPRAKISLVCADDYFKTERVNYLLLDETYSSCTLRLPLALKERWGGRRSFYVVPRLSATMYAKDAQGKGSWVPLSPLVNPGKDAFHRVLDSKGYKAVEVVGVFGKLTDRAGKLKPDTVNAGGKLTVCVAPVYRGEEPCVTFDVTSRFKVYTR
jgi:hypothetical protein